MANALIEEWNKLHQEKLETYVEACFFSFNTTYISKNIGDKIMKKKIFSL